MSGFVKLYGDRLLGSSLMDASVETRWLFICALADADQDDKVTGATSFAASRC